MILECLSILLWGLAVGSLLWGTWVVFARYPILSREKSCNGYPAVSVIKPLKGLDNGLEENLESFFLLDYPEFELLFCSEPQDPALQVLNGLFLKYPFVKARLIVGELDAGPNPKVNNMLLAYEQASFDHIWVSDSNVRVNSDSLRRMVEYFGAKVGAVTAVIAGEKGEGFGGALECLFLNTFYARWMYMAGALGIPFIVGKLMFFRRSTLERFGGMATLARYVAEDYMAGQAIKKMGLQIVIMSEPVVQHVGHLSLKRFWDRHIRWGRIRKAQTPLAFLLEPLLGSIVSGCLGAWAFSECFGFSSQRFLLWHLLVWFLCDLLIFFRMARVVSLLLPIAWFIRELTALPLWIQIASGNSVNWRGNRLKILPGGLVIR